MKVKHMTFLAMYTTIALTIFVVEAMLPPLAPIPGIKLGLANVVTLWLLYYATWKDALCVLLMRILIASMVTGQMVSFSYSLCGGLFCFVAMALLFRLLGKKHIPFISVIGALFHGDPSLGKYSCLSADADHQRNSHRSIHRTVCMVCIQKASKRPGVVYPLIHGFQRHICLDILNCCNKNRVPKTGLCFCFAAFHPG